MLVTVLTLARFGFDVSALMDRAVAVHPLHEAILAPRAIAADPVSGLSLGIALILGTSGLPRILMRFFTVPDARAARAAILDALRDVPGAQAHVYAGADHAFARAGGQNWQGRTVEFLARSLG